MRRSTDRILTTHAGSLPRPDDLREMITAKDEGRPYDPVALAHRVQGAVTEVVQMQINCGIDIINDGRGVETQLLHLRPGAAQRI